jgi:hypothetical protein
MCRHLFCAGRQVLSASSDSQHQVGPQSAYFRPRWLLPNEHTETPADPGSWSVSAQLSDRDYNQADRGIKQGMYCQITYWQI